MRRGLPAPARSSTASATDLLREAKRRIAAEPGQVRAEGLRRDRRRRHAGASTSRTCRSTSSDCRRSATTSGADCAQPIQHAVYKGFVAPVALYGVLGAVMLRNRRSADDGGEEATRGAPCQRRGAGRRPTADAGHSRCSSALFGLGALLIVWRLVAGLGATTALNDGYPLGLWIAFDVVTGTALACGGYAVAHARLHPQQGQVPPAGPPGAADQRARLHAGRLRRRARRRPLVEHLEGAAVLLALEPELGAARSRALHHGLHRACCGSSCRRRSSSSCRTAPTCRCGASRAPALPVAQQGADLDHRPRHRCCRRCTSRRSAR